MHGKGKLTYRNGEVFDGEFDNGQRKGYGILMSPNGSKFSGYWDNDRWEGFGKHWNSESWEYYEGEYSVDKKNGKGRLIKSNLEILEGNFWDDKKEGDLRSKLKMHPVEFSKILKPFLK